MSLVFPPTVKTSNHLFCKAKMNYLRRIVRQWGKSKKLATEPPSVKWLLEHKINNIWDSYSAQTMGQTPLASLYRMYEYLVVGFTIGLRSEIEFFFNKPSWAVADIPDPADPDPERYAILSVLPYYLTKAFNRLIERGLPRGSPAIIAGKAVEDRLKSRPIVLEKEPSWVAHVSRLEKTLIISGIDGEELEDANRSERFAALNILIEEPHVLFV